ncbi:sulfatase-like hydrolase/transferase [Neolewinella lacunae]|uniref:Sulfatase-like hydrolase/transferase n=1 Tax=Neolewinella lacunae TaxID=1517758 RepID=A0A923PRV7_9BACT|nr:sulfatase-like hydrolase/transferase [Neolewinella lacunae]MBC6996616.1 sulfatase-like hydrolase/transferase [Neolewinella lacunae]MDN3634820.1 sulfatase-like hydrolase/transferase [Neolewinella lacunae]
MMKTNMRYCRGGILALLCSLLCTCGRAPENEKRPAEVGADPRPNVILIIDDQHRYDALGKVNPQVLTPTLDSLAASGIHFTQAVCQAPMCVPSRNSVMFGLYPSQTGVFRNSDGVPDTALPGKTMAQYFSDAGYETAGFGKTHWGKHRTGTRGFETRYSSEIPEDGGITMAMADSAAKARYDAEIGPMGPGEENNIGYLGFTSALPEEDHRDGWINQQALRYLREREDDRPLFFYLSYMKPHAGHNPPAGYEDLYHTDSIRYAVQPPWDLDYSPHASGVNRRELYEGFWKTATPEQWRLMTMRYYANVTWIDDMLGRVLSEMKRGGLLDNAIVVYTSDHGEMLGERYYRFNKYCLYDASVRVPLIVTGSAVANGVGTEDARPVDLVDVLPTLLQAAGITPDAALPGVNLLAPAAREGSFSALHEREGEAAFMWRTAEEKLILVLRRKDQARAYGPEDIITGEFYDLAADPREWNDLYGRAGVAQQQQKFTQAILEKLSGM